MFRVGNDVGPYYFFSYSRADSAFVETAKQVISSFADGIWHDVDQIQLGDQWLSEIYDGIRRADELVLFASNFSLKSQIVRQEIEFAKSIGKKIRPILLETLDIPLPQTLSEIHYIDMATYNNLADKLREIFKDQGPDIPGFDPPAYPKYVKQYCVNSIWPRFSPELLSPPGQDALVSVANGQEQSLPNYSEASPMMLNSGLVRCILGEWDVGIKNSKLMH